MRFTEAGRVTISSIFPDLGGAISLQLHLKRLHDSAGPPDSGR